MVGKKPSPSSEAYPKSARLLSSRDFRFLPFKRFDTSNFRFVFTARGHGRLGISVSKKVSKKAVARNRIKRLVKETFRKQKQQFKDFDIHVIALRELGTRWRELHAEDVKQGFKSFLEHLEARKQREKRVN